VKSVRMLVCIFALMVASVLNADQPKRAGDDARRHGIVNYSIRTVGDSIEIALLNESGTSEGLVRLTPIGEGRAAEYVAVDAHTLRLGWNLALGVATVATESDLQPVVMTFDFKARKWARSEHADELLNSLACARLIAVLRDADRLQLSASAAAFVPAPHTSYYFPDGTVQPYHDDYQPADVGGAWSPGCSGPQVWGSWAADWKSIACSKARNDANVQCWNQYCVGCCNLDECNAVCLVGDAVCYAGVLGTSCSAH